MATTPCSSSSPELYAVDLSQRSVRLLATVLGDDRPCVGPEGDYIYREVQLLDLKRGALVEDWSATVTGESRVDWHHAFDLLLIDDELHLLGDAIELREIGAAATFLR